MSRFDQRDEILARIRRALGAADDDPERRLAVMKRLFDHPPGTVPARARRPRDALVAQFISMLESQAAQVSRLERARDIPKAVVDTLRRRNLALRIRHGSDPYLAALDWASEPALTRHLGAATADDAAGLSRALAGISETGTLLLASGPDNPTTINFLPPLHIVVVREADIVGSYEEGWAQLRALYGERSLPRAVNLVSGPSRTADIEQTLIMGAHGPVALHVFIVGSD